jgi:aspartate/methionine/tyrosine aminotransferase
MNKGIDALCEAAAGWLGDALRCRGRSIPAHEILVLNGSREGLFLAAIAARAGSVADAAARPC